MQAPILSVVIPTFNHENYISQTLDSVLMQKTKYPMEILVGEDFSTDNTRSILKKYESEYPNRFQMFYRDHNMNKEPITNVIDLVCRCKGKYLIVLEGDDFWTDPLKLDKQISFLETHPDYYAVAHNCVVVDNDSTPNGETYPECTDEEYTVKHYFSNILPGQTATFMYNNFLGDSSFHSDYPSVPSGTPGDRILYYMLLVNDKKIYCIQEAMSAYRHVTNSGTSFSATYKAKFEQEEPWYKAQLLYTEKYKVEWLRYAKILYLEMLIYALLKRFISLKTFYTYFKKETLQKVFFACVFYIIKKRILKKKILI